MRSANSFELGVAFNTERGSINEQDTIVAQSSQVRCNDSHEYCICTVFQAPGEASVRDQSCLARAAMGVHCATAKH
jgi:hypothetical protein